MCVLQVSRSFTKRLIFEACLWIKSYRMKRGVKHDKVRSCLPLLPAAECAQLQQGHCR